jgi:hypothetical protein
MTGSRETTPTHAKSIKIRRDSVLRPLLVALIRAHDGELFISHLDLGEAAIFDGEIVFEQTEDGSLYRLAERVEVTEDTP